ncbi:MAG TPA: HD domain-containing protein [Myxococcaceae bacterium]|nr:HD domain-containing protein [Myxococcaceae bacterium]
MRIRDPIHGTIPVDDREKAVIDHPFYQRLRHVKQLGFGDLAFPGATHTRHAHSLGAMHVSSRLFDVVSARADLSSEARSRFRAAVRLAVLCHDLGHMPLSHASEAIAPARGTLRLPGWLADQGGELASHEDFTAKILLDSSLGEVIEKHFAGDGVPAEALVALITGSEAPGGIRFSDRGVDWTPLLRAIVSGELDADRMDYLLRDSFYTGVNYGRYDLDWIVQNLNAAVKDDRAYLALSRAAAFAFEDFLLSRYHMFISVYYHHTPVNFDQMLRRYYREAPGEFSIPSDPEGFLFCDDVALALALRRSQNGWAKRIVSRQGYKLLAQFTERDEGYDLSKLVAALAESGIDHFSVESRGVLSKYFEEGKDPSLFIVDVSTGRLTEVAKYTPLYQRYSGAVRLSRLYVRPEQIEAAQAVLANATREREKT